MSSSEIDGAPEQAHCRGGDGSHHRDTPIRSVGWARGKGREPPSKKPCPTHGHSSKRKGSQRGKENGASNGKKCSTK